MNGAAIANCLARNGLDVHLVLSSLQMMDNRNGYFSDALFAELLVEYQSEEAKCFDKISIASGVEINCDLLRRELDAGRQIILETFIPGNADGIHDHVLLWIIVYGYEGEMFQVCDPLSSKIKLTAEALDAYMDTPIGKIYLAVGASE